MPGLSSAALKAMASSATKATMQKVKEVAASEATKAVVKKATDYAKDAAIDAAKDIAVDLTKVGIDKVSNSVGNKIDAETGQILSDALHSNLDPLLDSAKETDLSDMLHEYEHLAEENKKDQEGADTRENNNENKEGETNEIVKETSEEEASADISTVGVASGKGTKVAHEWKPETLIRTPNESGYAQTKAFEKVSADLKASEKMDKAGSGLSTVSKVASVASIAGGIIAAPATGGSSLAAATLVVKAATVAEVVSGISGHLFSELSSEKQEELKKLAVDMPIPPKEDILIHFNDNKLRYVKYAKISMKGITEKNDERIKEFFSSRWLLVGKSFVEKMMTMYYTFDSIEDSAEKVRFIATLGYLYDPMGLIPDILPSIGYIDDSVIVDSCYQRFSSFFTNTSKGKAKDFVSTVCIKQSGSSVNQDHIVSTDIVPVTENLSTEEIPDEIGGIKTLKLF